MAYGDASKTGVNAVRHFLASHKTVADIERDAYKIDVLERSTYRLLRIVSLSSDTTTRFVLRTLTSESVPGQLENEIGAIRFIRKRSRTVQVPEVISYSVAQDNEWLAFAMPTGNLLSSQWNTMTIAKKQHMVDAMAEVYLSFTNLLASSTAFSIGGFTCDGSIGETVETAKSSGRQGIEGYNKGPYRSVQEYVQSYVDKEIMYYKTSSLIDMDLFNHFFHSLSSTTPSISSETFDDDDDDDDFSDIGSCGRSQDDLSLSFDSSNFPTSSSTVSGFRRRHSSGLSFVHLPTSTQCTQNRENFIEFLASFKALVGDRVTEEPSVFVHGDFSTSNIYVDATNSDITCIFNWDFAGFYPKSLAPHGLIISPGTTLTFPNSLSSSLGLSVAKHAAHASDHLRRGDDDGDRDADDEEESAEWTRQFNDAIGGPAPEPDALVYSCLEPMDPVSLNAWEDDPDSF